MHAHSGSLRALSVALLCDRRAVQESKRSDPQFGPMAVAGGRGPREAALSLRSRR